MQPKMPVLFIGHGSPVNIVMNNSFTNSLTQLAQQISIPKAIMVISAHWLTKKTAVTLSQQPETIYDFFGFPSQLYEVKYPCPGAPQYAQLARDTVQQATISGDRQRGLDHAAWAILHHMYPNADIPVFEMSLDYSKSPEAHYQFAKELAPLREHGVLIIGSGNIVHNLAAADFGNIDASPYPWALDFDLAVKEQLLNGSHQKLIHYENYNEHSPLAIPTNEHYLPMLYAAALQENQEQLRFIHEGMQNASISMRSFMIGS
jgi:4,5-DOPA dioxygenase extradiol